jgi:phospho-N-acetylmuramoyl-pentapeptide-transferase
VIPGIFDEILGVQLFGYISFRVAMAGLTAFLLGLWWGRPTIAWLRSHRVIEDLSVSDLVPIEAARGEPSKHDTPTMGGSFLIASLLCSTVLWCRLDNVHVVLGILLTAGLAAVGFMDDFKKLTIQGCQGLSTRSKMVGMTLVTLGVVGAFVTYAVITGRTGLLDLHLPLLKDIVVPLGAMGLTGIACFLAFEWLIVVGTANAANVTDGLDGLAAGCMIISGLTLSIFCYVAGRWDWTEYLLLPHVPSASEMAVLGGSLCGACLGFLWFNCFPARVFMGDSGSLPIGGLLAWMALVAKQELVLPLIAAVFFADLASSALQFAWYRHTGGRRLFTCAPVHHGLERYGGVFRAGPAPWHEVTVTVRAWIVASVCAMAGLALLKVR